MIRRSIVGMVAAAGVSLSSGLVLAQDEASGQPSGEAVVIPVEELPSVAEFFDGHIEAVGGEDAFRAVTSRRFSGRVSIYQQGREEPIRVGRLEMLAEAPGLLVQDTIFPGQGSARTVVKDGVVWQVDEAEQATEVTGEVASRQIASARFYQLADWETLFASTEVVDGVVQGGRRIGRVQATHHDGRVEIFVFDLDTGLQLAVIGQRASLVDSSQQVMFQRVYEDYREVEGLLYPHRVVDQAGPIAIEILLNEIETGVEIPEIEIPEFSSDEAEAASDR